MEALAGTTIITNSKESAVTMHTCLRLNSLQCTESVNVLNYMINERGVHRVSRIPFNSDKIHTSAASIVIFPKSDESKIDVDYRDLHFELTRSSGPGGRNVDHSRATVRATHIPTGIKVTVGEERHSSQVL
ncbi:hypothetical protein MXB_4827 [Myxobolus squamalis]|nr:hypothetical protein MXB_4827 [Myxobolus squamalis]